MPWMWCSAAFSGGCFDLGVLRAGQLDYACGMGMCTGTLTIV
ncbi:hypothetical protein [Amycolatopsis sp. NPDC098790]